MFKEELIAAETAILKARVADCPDVSVTLIAKLY